MVALGSLQEERYHLMQPIKYLCRWIDELLHSIAFSHNKRGECSDSKSCSSFIIYSCFLLINIVATFAIVHISSKVMNVVSPIDCMRVTIESHQIPARSNSLRADRSHTAGLIGRQEVYERY